MTPEQLIAELDKLSEADRDEVLGAYCRQCHTSIHGVNEYKGGDSGWCFVCEPDCDSRWGD